MIERMLAIYKTVGRAHGMWLAPIGSGIGFLVLRTVVFFSMLLDNLRPGLSSQKVDRPIMIIGPPRTGTTFLQRYLCELGAGEGMPVWRMMFASPTLQFFIKPILPILDAVSPVRHHATVAHKTSLVSIEASDAALMLRYLDGFFLYSFFLAFSDDDYGDFIDPEVRDTSERDFGWLRSIWRRDLHAQGADRVVAKLFSGAARVGPLLKAFPDAKLIYTVRDPLNVVPSTLSLVTGVLDSAFGFWSKPEAVRTRYIERVYAQLVKLSRRFHRDYTSGSIPKDRLFLMRFDRMMSELEVVLPELYAFMEVEMSDEVMAQIVAKAEKQRQYKSKHGYDLAKFGLSEERIRSDFDFVYESFLS